MTAGQDATSNAIALDVASRRRLCLAFPHPAAHGLLSLISLLRAFLLNAIKRNLVCCQRWHILVESQVDEHFPLARTTPPTHHTLHAVLGLGDEAAPVAPLKRESQIKYSDKKRVARFREYSDVLFEKRGMDETMNALIHWQYRAERRASTCQRT